MATESKKIPTVKKGAPEGAPKTPSKGWWARNYGSRPWYKAATNPATTTIGKGVRLVAKAPVKIGVDVAKYANVMTGARKFFGAFVPDPAYAKKRILYSIFRKPSVLAKHMSKVGVKVGTKLALKSPIAAAAGPLAGPISLFVQQGWDNIYGVNDFIGTSIINYRPFSREFESKFSPGFWKTYGKFAGQGLIRGLDYLTMNLASDIANPVLGEDTVEQLRGEPGVFGRGTQVDDHGYGRAIEKASTPAEAAKIAKKFEEAELTALASGRTIYGDDLYDVDAKTGKLYKVTKEEGARRAKVILSASEAGKRARALSAYDEEGKKLVTGQGDLASMRKKLTGIWSNYEQKLNRLDAELENWDEDALRREASSAENGNLRRIAQTKLRLGKEGYEDLVVNNLNNEVARYRAPLVESALYKKYMDNQYQEYAKAQRMLVEKYAPQMLNDPGLDQKIKGVWDANFSDTENEDYSRAREILGSAENIFQEEESQIIARARATRDAQEATIK